jgi:hypothetical protein
MPGVMEMTFISMKEGCGEGFTDLHAYVDATVKTAVHRTWRQTCTETARKLVAVVHELTLRTFFNHERGLDEKTYNDSK